MKKTLLLAGALLASVVVTGCAGVNVNSGSPAPVIGAGPCFFADYSGSAMIQPLDPATYTVIQSKVTATAKARSIFTCVVTGDLSYAALKNAAIATVKGADDLINIRIDYNMNTILGVSDVTATITGTAIKFNK